MDLSQQPNSMEYDSGTLTKALLSNLSINALPPIGTVTEFNGFTLLPSFDPHTLEYVSEKWDMPENSIFVTSFQKTGTAWTYEIVRQILYGRDENLLAISKSLSAPLFALEVGTTKKFDAIGELPIPRKIFVTHSPEELFNFEKMKKRKGKMIYLLRNPKDQAVSLFHFFHEIPFTDELRKEFGMEWNDFFHNYIQGKIPLFMKKEEWYPDHILAWMKHKNDENVLIVVYEDMKRDFHRGIRRIARFLDVELDDDDVAKIADVCSITSMQKASNEDKSGFHKLNVRKGEVGGWKNVFTVAQSELMDRLIEEKLGKSGIDFTYVL